MNKYCDNCDRLLKIVSTPNEASLKCLTCNITHEIKGKDAILYKDDRETVPLEVKIRISNMELIDHNPVDYSYGECMNCKEKNTMNYIVDGKDHKYYYKCRACLKTSN